MKIKVLSIQFGYVGKSMTARRDKYLLLEHHFKKKLSPSSLEWHFS